MNHLNRLLILLTFIIVTIVLMVAIIGAGRINAMEVQARISFLWNSIGGLIAILSALVLLLQAAAGRSLRDLLPLTLPLLGGAAILHGGWSAVLALGLIVTSVVVCHHCCTGGKEEPRDGSGPKAH